MTSHLQHRGELEYGSILPNGEDWRLRKCDAGMGETEYRIFKNEVFFAQFDNRKDAEIVMTAMCCASHSSAPSRKNAVKNCMCDKYTNCTDCFNHDEEIRKDEREKVLGEIVIWCQDGISKIQEKMIDGYILTIDDEKTGLLDYEIQWLKELRSKQGEQSEKGGHRDAVL